MTRIHLCLLLALNLLAHPALAAEFHVSPTGTPQGDGSESKPWDLATALAHPAAVKPGDTLWLHGGTYRGAFQSVLKGTAEAPILVRQAPKERAVIALEFQDRLGADLNLKGEYVRYQGFEVTNENPKRRTEIKGSWPEDLIRGSVQVRGNHLQLVNLVIHDLGQGVGFWSEAAGGELNGCLIYHNGWNAPDRGHGHAIYAQNERDTKRVVDCVLFNQFGHGMQVYGSSKATLKGFQVIGNIVFGNGSLVEPGHSSRGLLVGGEAPMEDVLIEHNYTWGSGLQVGYPWGVTPLQQYLIPFPGGRLQALNICWDTRPQEQGGQRWFHLFPNEEVAPDDVLHWTKRHFNWNYMCADCHSTNLAKNYDVETNSYHTTWSEMNVSCEACHGPASGHLAWARETDPAKKAAYDLAALGFLVNLKESKTAVWAPDPATGHPKRSHPLENNHQMDTCMPCHAHRQLLQTQFHHGQDFLDTHAPTVLDRIHYHADGQINEEVYEYGSFVQSKMYHASVRCTDCHHPHTMQTYAPGNQLCNRCHQPEKYDTPAHHFHPAGSTGASCVECHMPPKTYMVIDQRRDHSIRVPRPDLSVTYGTPNACTTCHQNPGQDNQWAAQAFAQWWGTADRPSYAESLAKGRRDPEVWRDVLARLAANPQEPGIVRASALELISERPSPQGIAVMEQRLRDPEPLVRRQALTGLEALPIPQRVPLATPLLRDPVRAVRVEAARILAGGKSSLAETDAPAFDAALAEYIESQNAVADVPEGHMGLAILYTNMGDLKRAEAEYLAALKIEAIHLPSRVNLADLYRTTGRMAEAEALLREGIRLQPKEALAHEQLGRHFLVQRSYEEGIRHITQAVQLAPDRADLQYLLGVGLFNPLGRYADALPHLQKAHELEPRNPEYLQGLATICAQQGDLDLALTYARKLATINSQAAGLVHELEAMKAAQPR